MLERNDITENKQFYGIKWFRKGQKTFVTTLRLFIAIHYRLLPFVTVLWPFVTVH